MSQSVFAHGVFGVAVKRPAEFEKAILDEAFDDLTIVERLEDGYRNEAVDYLDPLVTLVRVKIKELRLEWQLPADFPAYLFYSGGVGSRPGRCYTATKLWIFGIGMFQTVEVALQYPEDMQRFKAHAVWHSWVTSS